MMYNDLTQKQAKEMFDYVDGQLFWKNRLDMPQKWNTKWAGEKAGTISNDRKTVGVNNKRFQFHRIVWVIFNGEIPPNTQIDHINGNALDNRIENLRLATHSENARNSKISRNNSSGYKNVVWDEFCQLWLVSLYANGKSIRKRFKDLDKAVEFAKVKRMELHGQFANHGQHLAEAA